jgi:hypothetical protein
MFARSNPTRPVKWPGRRGLIIALLALVSAALVLAPGAIGWRVQAEAGTTVFLPLALKSGSSPNPPPTVTPPPTPPPSDRGAFFINPETKTGSASLKIDAQGGMHLAFADFIPTAEHPRAVYMYCPGKGAACADPGKWQSVALSDLVYEVQLALTPDGKPRMLIRTATTHNTSNSGNDFYYAACDSACTTAAGWTVSYILSNDGTSTFDISDLTSPQRSFALDPQGRPRFVYQDRNYLIEPDHYGAFYAYCDANCTAHTPGNPTWSQVQIALSTPYDAEVIEYPSLAFTKTGAPRVVGNLFALDDPQSGLTYFTCDATCDQPTSWQRVRLWDRGSTPEVSWDLELDSQDRPRIAFYEGDQLGDAGDRLHYLWCDAADCLTDSNWWMMDLGLGSTVGTDADLELDAQDRPRIAYINGSLDGLGYVWCNSACQSDQAQWTYEPIETGAVLDAEFPVPRPSHCDAGFWNGLSPVMALDSAGNPRVAYDAKYDTRCWYDDANDNLPPYLQFWQLRHAVRVVIFPQK